MGKSNLQMMISNMVDDVVNQPLLVAQIYCPDVKHEILLAEHAQTLACKTLIQMSKTMPIYECFKSNTADMTPQNYVPVIRIEKTKANCTASSTGLIISNFQALSGYLRSRISYIRQKKY